MIATPLLALVLGLLVDQDSRRRPGAANRGGHVWVERSADPVIFDYEIRQPDEPGLSSSKLLLLGREDRTDVQWDEYKRERLGR